MTDQEHTSYTDPVDFPIPEGTDPVGCLYVNLDRAEGVLVSLRDGREVDPLTMKAICCAVGLTRQSQALVDYWHKLEEAEAATKDGKTEKEPKHSNERAITVELFLTGDSTVEKKKAVLKRMLTGSQPTSVDRELFFLEGFRIL